MQKLVVIGAGMASGRVLETLFDADPNAYEVTLFNAEARGNYNRIMLSPVLSGEKSYAEIVTHDDAWYADHKVTCRFGEKVVSIDRKAKVVTGENGDVPYDKLIIATGSAPFIVPVEGRDLPGVITYRDLDDTHAMIAASARPGARAVVIGGGLLGLEAAAGLRLRGMEVTVLHLAGHLMERQLDEAAGYLLKKDLEKRGIVVMTKASTRKILGETAVEGVELADGTVLTADLVVMAAGIRPAAEIAKNAGLATGRAITVNAQMQTSDPDIFAVGECVEYNGALFGLVAPLYDQAKVLARSLMGEVESFTVKELSTKLKVTGCDLFSAGDFAEGETREDIVLRDPGQGVYKRLVIENDRLIGAVMYGDTSDSNWFFDLIREGASIAAMRETLIFGPAYQGGSPLDPMAAVAALPDDAEICGCNGVCKSKITGAITAKGLTSLDEVRAHTKASSSCGTCTGLVEQLMSLTLGSAFDPNAVKPMCGCTPLSHDDVRRLIKAKELKTIPQVQQELGWSTPNGCAKCRPALNYYLVADWPDDYADDYQSRFINERVHANIQKDGTYSVVPRMWGGMTSSRELRAIADVVDKFDIPAVKCTGGQRIDMLGVRKEDLPAVWADLGKAGFVSGQAYAKGLRTVKTCVGTDWCRFGTQDSTGLGIRIEKFMWGSWTPAKLKLAVSGCPRNCAEATCKDIGIICVDSGFDIHFAGAAGLDIKGTEILGHVDTEDEALEHVVALAQMYREQGHYLERIYKWARRIGLDEIRRQIMDDHPMRKAYFDRFVFSQTFAQVDPWSERVSGKDKHEFRPMAKLEFADAAE
ncbi:nitrite reductase large subunit NirB [Fulvimarina sp. 2208YS6-2-32]|uniref:Nitrite reductase large subunit NirB n=1 Tax=Fulvimarina uroteuthidis TaxID=3098149 RepID=A0ABU5I3S3_9HYPH|nr:nitrite reductase large subunit NirB [Fulvimarina sp. 2208YS6-2-32]MDY8108816.1 nitrite reductase large subunit NirB [Fulvimarina sp. 2208YS6-2-32]